MTCKVCQRLIFELLDGDLPASQEAMVEAHAQSCPECGRFLDAERARTSGLPKLLDRAAVDGKLPPAAIERLVRHMRPATKRRNRTQGERPPE